MAYRTIRHRIVPVALDLQHKAFDRAVKRQPAIVLFEHSHFSFDYRWECLNFLVDSGYRVPVEELPIGQPITSHVAQPPRQGGAIRLVMVGSQYSGGCEFLVKTLKLLKGLSSKIELVYAGAHFPALPSELRAVTRYLGDFRDDESYRRMLADAHIGILTGPSELDCYGKFSFPSRSVDYLMAGLPILGYFAPGSATEDVLTGRLSDCVINAPSPNAFVEGLSRLTDSTESWKIASNRARRHALECMSIEAVRERLARSLVQTSQHYAASARSCAVSSSSSAQGHG